MPYLEWKNTCLHFSKQIAGTKKTISCLPWLMALVVQRETERAVVGARAAAPGWAGVGQWLVAVDGVLVS